jgi:lysozyme family protein
MANFETALAKTLIHEGGYVNDPSDSGGETNFGISKRSYPNVNIKALTKETAGEIYERDFWNALNCGQINDDALASKVFDLAVNCGTETIGKMLQEAVCSTGLTVKVDGKIGPVTIRTINMLNAVSLLAILKGLAEARYRKIVAKTPSDSKFLKGWLIRLAS